MSTEPIYVRIEVGSKMAELTIVGDAADAMLAVQIGQSVSEALLNLSS